MGRSDKIASTTQSHRRLFSSLLPNTNIPFGFSPLRLCFTFHIDSNQIIHQLHRQSTKTVPFAAS